MKIGGAGLGVLVWVLTVVDHKDVMTQRGVKRRVSVEGIDGLKKARMDIRGVKRRASVEGIYEVKKARMDSRGVKRRASVEGIDVVKKPRMDSDTSIEVLGRQYLKVMREKQMFAEVTFEDDAGTVRVGFLVDTGAHYTSIDPVLALDLGLVVQDGYVMGQVVLDNGMAVSVRVRVTDRKLRIPLLGCDFFSHYNVKINPRKGRMIVRQPTSGYPTPMSHTRPRRPYAKVSVAGRRFKALLDTGATHTTLKEDTARDLQLSTVRLPKPVLV